MELNKIKPEIRIVGFDDCAFTRKQKDTLVVGAIYRGGSHLDGLISTKIKVDGLDSTEKLTECIKKSKHYDQLRIIMLNGITLGGFNIVDINKLFSDTELPVISIVRQNPNLTLIQKALENFQDSRIRLDLIKKAGRINRLEIQNNITQGILHYQMAGIENEIAEKIIKLTSTRSIVPEPLRAADLICSGLKYGEKIKQ